MVSGLCSFNGVFKKLLVSVFICFLLIIVSNAVDAEDLFMYCGAGLRQPVDEVLSGYMKKSGEKVVVEFGGAGQLLTRYRATGRGDLFLPGSDFYTDQLFGEGKVTTVYPLVLHVPVVAVNRNSSDRVKSFDDLAWPGVRVGLGDHRAMALGRTAAAILEKSGLKNEILKNTIVYAATVKQLTLYVTMGNVDAAIIARADAFQNSDKLVYFDINRRWYNPEVVTIAVLKTSKLIEKADKLAEYFDSANSIKIFSKYGFLSKN